MEEFNCKVMSVVLQYIHTGSCYIVTSHLPSLIAAADRYFFEICIAAADRYFLRILSRFDVI